MLYSWKIVFIRILIIKLLIIHNSNYFTHRINNIILIFSSVVEFQKLLVIKYKSG